MKKYVFLLLVMPLISSQTLSCGSPMLKKYLRNEIDVILFSPVQYGNYLDIKSYREISGELGLTTKEVNHGFINQRESFFDKDGQRKFKVLILPGGDMTRWFEQTMGQGLNCQGVKNISDFIESRGSVIAICACGSSLFATFQEHFGPTLKEAQRGEWHRTHHMRRFPGLFQWFCGINPFKGIVRWPQETNRPYPTKVRFLPIKMNPENDIVREAKLPSIIYQIVTGGGSLIPYEGQPLDIVGWYPNGTVAIGVVPYGRGKIILSNPHPNITGEEAMRWIDGPRIEYQRQWGCTEQMIAEGRKLIQTEGDPDGPKPDWALAKAMLSYAYKEASR